MRDAGLCLLLCGVLCAGAIPRTAAAQQTDLAPSAATSCLTHVDGIDRPVYPPESLQRKDGGSFEATLRFDDGRTPPRVTFSDATEASSFSALRASVERFAAGLRVPCRAADAGPTVLQQTYIFVPNDGRKVVRSRPRDAADVQRRQQLQCIRHAEGKLLPDYPESARRGDMQGNVLVRLVFTAADQPPASEVLASVPSRILRDSVAAHDAGLRMPCFSGAPVELHRVYQFRLDGGTRLLVKDLTLVQFLGAVKDRPSNVFFDLTQMGCPFDVRIVYNRPHRPSEVLELEVANPARAAFLDWLAAMTFDTGEFRNTALLGQDFVVHVPCTIVDL